MEQIGTPETYLTALEVSLKQKDQILQTLLALTKEQERILTQESFDPDAFDAQMEQKEKQLEQLDRLDAGFESVYARVRESMQKDKERYRDRIIKLQEKITHLTELGVEIETLEKRNRDKFLLSLQTSRDKIRRYKVGSQAAAKYYRNMANQPQGESYFVDKKK